MKKFKKIMRNAKYDFAIISLSLLLRCMFGAVTGVVYALGYIFLTKEQRAEARAEAAAEELAIREAWAKSLAEEGFPVPGYEYLEGGK